MSASWALWLRTVTGKAVFKGLTYVEKRTWWFENQVFGWGGHMSVRVCVKSFSSLSAVVTGISLLLLNQTGPEFFIIEKSLIHGLGY